MSPDAPKAFVLMPSGAQFDSLYTDLIKPALEDAGFDSARAASLLEQQNIIQAVVRGIASADLVVAEVTGRNPNVLYELGLAHGLRVPTLLLAQDLKEVPFDLRGYRVEVYSTRLDEIGELKDALREVAEEHSQGRISFGSPVADFLEPGQGASVRDEQGILDEIAAFEEAAERFGESGARLARAGEDVAEDLERHAAMLEQLRGQEGQAATAGIRRVAVMAASDLTRYASRLESELPTLDSAVNTVFSGGLGFFARAEAASESEREGLGAAMDEVSGLLEGVRGGLGAVRTMRSTLSGLTGLDRDLDRAVRRVVRDLARVITALERIEAFAERSLAILGEKLEEDSPGQSG